MFDNMWTKVPGLVNTLNNEGEMDQMLAKTEENINFTSVRVPSLTWDDGTGKEILTNIDGSFGNGSWVSSIYLTKTKCYSLKNVGSILNSINIQEIHQNYLRKIKNLKKLCRSQMKRNHFQLKQQHSLLKLQLFQMRI